MSLQKETIELSRLYGITPTKNRGQSFLIEESVYEKIISSAQIKKDETVLEIGPGLGFLTSRLAAVSKEVVAVELDKKLANALANRLTLEKITNVKIFNNDIMNFAASWVEDVKKIPNDKLVVVANLPYTITSIFLRYFIGGNLGNILPTRFILMLQKEVAERIVALPGEMSILTLSVQLYTEARIVDIVDQKSFWPVPKVHSAIVEMRRSDHYLKILKANNLKEKDLLRLIKIGFSSKRKMLKANLSGGYKISQDEILNRLNQAGIKPSVRAQELSLQNWIKLLLFFS